MTQPLRSRRAVGSLAIVASLFLAACGCAPKKGTDPGTGSAGSGSAGSGNAADCEAARANVTALYQSQSTVGNAAKNATFVADNVAMVMTDCAADPAKVAACAAAAKSVADLERDCLLPIDDEGSEGDRLTK
ncbi:MAG: hypothetical protein K8W52_33205 [Deltaproteobacteria bacterium]|nr:hypothetical protein [Deltaproteobacteria bacterium]